MPKDITVAPHLSLYQIAPSAYLADHSSITHPVSHLVAAAIVIHSKKILLLQRSSHAFVPLKWEVPGGKCEQERDATVVAAAVRELREEAGLVASRVTDVVDTGQEWVDGGEHWKKITFMVELEHSGREDQKPQVQLQATEHVEFVWASEEDVLSNRCGDIPLDWTFEDQKRTVLDAFRILRLKSER
ncbi:NUDIX hydrolase domain-like protein [Xylariaceae sp. FL0016]|nr:NUDIX hydrolase domain-like protein [Xylariaceae sp. FL0016]